MKAIVTALFLVSASASASASAQSATVPPETQALRTCAELADRGQADSAAAVGKSAEAIFRKRIAKSARDVEALVGLGRTLAQCLLPAANFIGQGTLSHEAMGVLEDALDLQPDHWIARFVLASIAYRSPAFLGRGDVAAKHFDELIRRTGSRVSEPLYPRVFEYRGMQWMRAGKPDTARALWTRGLFLFPNDSALAALMARSNAAPPRVDSVTSIPMMRITARAERAPVAPPPPPVREVTRGEILTTAGGAADVFSAVQIQPGATLVGEGSSVYTRGGDASETITILNGSRVLSLNRFEGLNGGMFGALEPWVIKSLRYATGAFSVRHGNALSGVIDIETEGKPRERRTRAGLSLVQASGTMWLPAGRKAGGWVSARASQTAALLATHGRSDEFDRSPHSEEVIASAIATPTPELEVRTTAMLEQDDSRRIVNAAGWQGPFQSTASSRAVFLSSRWAKSPLTVQGNLSAGTRSTDFRYGILARERNDRALNGRIDGEYAVADALTLRGGVSQGLYDRSERGVVPTSPSVATGAPARILDEARATASDRGAYAEAEATRGGSSLTAGVRADRLPGEDEMTFDPRATIAHRRGNLTMRLGGGLFHQGRWRADAAIPDAGVPSGIARAAAHLVGGIEHESRGRVLRAEAYRKRYSDYRPFGAGPQTSASEATGLDLIAESRTAGPITGWVGYSLLDATATLVDGRKVRSPFDITHTASAAFTAAISNWSVGMTGRYGTGAPTSPVIGAIADSNGFPRPVYGKLMSARLPAYGRVDLRVMRYFRLPTVLVTSFVETINLTNRRNVSGVTWDAGYRNRDYVHTFFSQRTLVVGAEAQFR